MKEKGEKGRIPDGQIGLGGAQEGSGRWWFLFFS